MVPYRGPGGKSSAYEFGGNTIQPIVIIVLLWWIMVVLAASEPHTPRWVYALMYSLLQRLQLWHITCPGKWDMSKHDQPKAYPHSVLWGLTFLAAGTFLLQVVTNMNGTSQKEGANLNVQKGRWSHLRQHYNNWSNCQPAAGEWVSPGKISRNAPRIPTQNGDSQTCELMNSCYKPVSLSWFVSSSRSHSLISFYFLLFFIEHFVFETFLFVDLFHSFWLLHGICQYTCCTLHTPSSRDGRGTASSFLCYTYSCRFSSTTCVRGSLDTLLRNEVVAL